MEKCKKARRKIKKNVDNLLKTKGIKKQKKKKTISNQEHVRLSKILSPLFPHYLLF